ncbi:3D-(3,5/4)-trihydroxycyclohexane-1,2-dione acylhydrolase (decyclizing) [Nocardia seriolae]|uniref:acetolactate synthase n=2 Tax=Nocardia seriolae TaxID=37332 RepID=A0ABC8AZQ7_9NOCA|nr:3D-(3,5/4)-trihydroxycyclohexane-1,2-dione acylhydrolase (decyclizing) [Nocardia seriolae]APA99545.1 3D-(3,5/4)-trihydroxycyclohexane-1,2-dione acylhydrolase (decyclizing) [Nocardia seriolae]QUN17704.1 3D-(3,5/4)-trihydroxycyclohexane-1,2-dione acylhydrolase (decyclizing) [Nocardia seriolae]WKY49708.1 3D-(3,5/4)-trihydroxycyclohexane-1,2-dione acylhydrolase (decyclizing) [Nocardia seriolae]WNJ62064.1 3D-(3,5/4)-trihydroxycyclohexane-1,2-dione acylhydrolase (decyclizing) [Nocardia seriolae]B
MKLTTAQALVAWLAAQRSETLDGREVPLFPAVFGIFGHGNVLGLGTALVERRDELPVWRGHTEEGMALAAVGLAKATHRRQVGIATSSIGPGALNMVTAAGVAHANRLPLLLLPGDTFVSRAPDPVLQQVEHYGDPTITVNDAFRPVSRYFDRITRPEQLIATLPQVARVLTDPADAGPVVLALPQDVQAETYDFPDALFEPVVHRVPRPRPDRRVLAEAAHVLREAQRPLLVLGGGVRYSGAGERVLEFALRHGIPVTETTAGRTLVPHDHPLYAGPLGITGAASANTLAAAADVVLAVGTRLQDFTTASWTVFAPEVRIVHINTARFDAVKHGALAVVGDADATLHDFGPELRDWRADPTWTARAATVRVEWDAHIDKLRSPTPGSPSYAQIVGAVNDLSDPTDYVMTASGGLPGELIGGWRATGGTPTMDVEYGFSCMGYELAGAWGAAMARPQGLVTTLLGDGSYLMLNSELFSAAFAGHPLVAVVCDNDGYAVIARLQEGQGGQAFNNFYADCRTNHADPPRVDFAAHARALGCSVFTAGELTEFRESYARARSAAVAERRPAVVVVRTQPSAWTESGAWWEVGVPRYLSGRAEFERGKPRQVRYTRPS